MSGEKLLEALEDFRPRVVGMLREVDKVSNLPRERSQIFAAIQNLEQFLGAASRLKDIAVELADEGSANELAATKFLFMSAVGELWTWIALKDNQYNDAHDSLVEAIGDLETASRFLVDEGLKRRADHLEAMYTTIFPKPMYSSPAFTFTSRTCSICGLDYTQCIHEAGKLYMGELCSLTPHGVNLVECSLVDHPKDRRCIVHEFTSNGRRIDRMTYKDLGSGMDANGSGDAMLISTKALAFGRTTERLRAREVARENRSAKQQRKKRKR